MRTAFFMRVSQRRQRQPENRRTGEAGEKNEARKSDPRTLSKRVSLLAGYVHFYPILHRPHPKTTFPEWTVEYFLFNLL